MLPRFIEFSTVESLMGQGKVAMMISGPWAWSNLTASGIDFGLALMPGVDGRFAKPFVGASVAYMNRASPNVDLIAYFVEHYLLSAEGLTGMDQVKPIGVPALRSLYLKMAKANPLIAELKAAVDQGQIMPNIPQMGRFFSAVGAALQIATQGHASAQEALRDAAANLQSQ